MATPRCALAGVAASEPAIVATATKAANVFCILGASLQDDAFDQRRWTVNPPRDIVSGQLTALIGAGFELLVAKS